MNGDRAFDKGKVGTSTSDGEKDKTSKIAIEDSVPVEITSLQGYIKQYVGEKLFDKGTNKPLDENMALVVTKKIQGLLKEAAQLEKYYNNDDKDNFLGQAKIVRQKMDEIVSKFMFSSTSSSKEEQRIDLYAQLLTEHGLNKDEEFAKACLNIKKDPTTAGSYDLMKKLIGEYLGRAILVEGLVSDEGTSDVVESGEPLFDKVFDTVYIIQKLPLEKDDFKESERSGLITGQPKLYGWVVGEMDSLFAIVHPTSKLYLPVVILESKGGALSTAAVSKQTSKEKERMTWVRDKPTEYALATRKGKKTGPFTDITDLFDLSRIDEDLEVSTSGPIRKGEHQYDITFNLTTKEVENLARYIAYKS